MRNPYTPFPSSASNSLAVVITLDISTAGHGSAHHHASFAFPPCQPGQCNTRAGIRDLAALGSSTTCSCGTARSLSSRGTSLCDDRENVWSVRRSPGRKTVVNVGAGLVEQEVPSQVRVQSEARLLSRRVYIDPVRLFAQVFATKRVLYPRPSMGLHVDDHKVTLYETRLGTEVQSKIVPNTIAI